MRSRTQFWVLTGLTGTLLVLVVVNIVMLLGNQGTQREINTRQALIQQGQQREALYREIAKDLADLSVARGDEQLRALLASQGITINVPQQPQSRAQAPAPAGAEPAAQNPTKRR
jgi:hypothetical protein